MHGKVSITRFNAPAGDTFQAISLAGGHVMSVYLTQKILRKAVSLEVNLCWILLVLHQRYPGNVFIIKE